VARYGEAGSQRRQPRDTAAEKSLAGPLSQGLVGRSLNAATEPYCFSSHSAIWPSSPKPLTVPSR